MYGLRNSELSTCLFQFSHKTRQLKQCCCTLILLPKSTLNANLTTNRFFTNDGWQRGRFENFKSDHQYKSNLESDVRFKIESNHEASQVPKNYTTVCPNLTDLWRHHEQCYSSSQNVSQRPVKVWINTLVFDPTLKCLSLINTQQRCSCTTVIIFTFWSEFSNLFEEVCLQIKCISSTAVEQLIFQSR